MCAFFFFYAQDWDVERGLPRGDDLGENGNTTKRCDDGGVPAAAAAAEVDDVQQRNGGGGGNSKTTGTGGRDSPARRVLFAAVKVIVIAAAITVTCAFIWYTMGLPFLLQVVVVAFIAFVASGGYKFIYLVYRTAPRDVK